MYTHNVLVYIIGKVHGGAKRRNGAPTIIHK